jgi:hypothetical protein
MGNMQLYRDDGVVLRTQKLGEADRIITVLARKTGRVRAVAKGVRRTKSRFGGRLEPFTHVDLMLHQGRSLDVITQAEVIRSYGAPLTADYPRYTVGVAMLETAERFMIPGWCSTPTCCGRCRWRGTRPRWRSARGAGHPAGCPRSRSPRAAWCARPAGRPGRRPPARGPCP